MSDASVLNQLTEFRERDLFSAAAWQARGLNPSNDELCQELRDYFRGYAGHLAEGVQSGYSPRKLKAILKAALRGLPQSHFDTEEREFIVDLFGELAGIVGVDIRREVNRWLYGWLLPSLVAVMRFLRPQRITGTARQACSECGTMLETEFVGKGPGPDEYWMIVRCNKCGELNLISIVSEAKMVKYKGYQYVESLSKDEFTHEQALIRMEQIRYFRS